MTKDNVFVFRFVLLTRKTLRKYSSAALSQIAKDGNPHINLQELDTASDTDSDAKLPFPRKRVGKLSDDDIRALTSLKFSASGNAVAKKGLKVSIWPKLNRAVRYIFLQNLTYKYLVEFPDDEKDEKAETDAPKDEPDVREVSVYSVARLEEYLRSLSEDTEPVVQERTPDRSISDRIPPDKSARRPRGFQGFQRFTEMLNRNAAPAPEQIQPNHKDESVPMHQTVGGAFTPIGNPDLDMYTSGTAAPTPVDIDEPSRTK